MSFRLSFSLILVLDSRISLVLFFFFVFSLLLFLSSSSCSSSFLYFLPLRSSHLLYLPLSPPPGSFPFLLSFPFSSSSLISCCSISSLLLFLPSTSYTNHRKRIKYNEKRQRKMRAKDSDSTPSSPKQTHKQTYKQNKASLKDHLTSPQKYTKK